MSKLTVTAEGTHEIHLTRSFDAPRRLVMRAMTTPELLARWLGNSRADMVSAEVDLRVGGRYRYVYRRKHDGGQFAFGGVFRELGEDRIVQVESFEGYPGESVVTSTFVEQAGKTTLKLALRFDSQEARDATLRSGMADGAGESYDNLEKLVASL